MSNTVNTINPFTEKTIQEYQLLSLDEANQAVDAAHECFESWRNSSLEIRQVLANKLASIFEEQKEEIAQLMTDEMGKVKAQGYQEIELCAAICRYSAEIAESNLASEKREFDQGEAIISYQPVGVILGIQPWNFPLYQVIRYSITNIIAGNTTVLKHASNVFGMAQKIQDMYEEAGFPKNCYQSLIIDGETSSKLIEHDKIRGVTFTGSDEIGKSVAEKAGKLAKKTVLELGSNDAFLVLDDADIELAIEACVKGRVINNGETCVSAKRFIVTEKNYDAFKEGFCKAMSDLKVGDPNDEDSDLGPMARKDLRDELHEQVKASIENGANAEIGGSIPERDGFFYPPTVLTNVKPGMPAYDDELFGPVASLIKVANDEEAIQVANDSRYGLGGGIFSKDTDKAIKIATERFDTGMVNINGYALAQPNLPFGGVKDSGYGREHGGFGMREFVNIKTVMVMS
uniref:NAD-dependent succinate-semialdehyde dehydrogenase n=1 Tax=Ningiella ruwaisensis TaxID=2364274 RepID=UPI00109F4FF8|nr:NAD-dependent succinate-semialdehyde dehydrogenase [Ningiella ruwaisensis]